MVSTDLVNWTYVGDAFPLDGGDIPAWIDPNAAFWAPEVVYSSSTDQYYLFVTVTETTAAAEVRHLRRRQRHRRRSRRQPDRSVDLLRRAGRPAAPDPGRTLRVLLDLRPDVLGDTVTDEGILYYGSYYGGIFATEVNFTEAGVTAATPAPATTPGSRSATATRAPTSSAGTATTTCSPRPPTAATAP